VRARPALGLGLALGLGFGACAVTPPPRRAPEVVTSRPLAPDPPRETCAGDGSGARPFLELLTHGAGVAAEVAVEDEPPAAARPFLDALGRSVNLRWNPGRTLARGEVPAADGYGDRYTEACVRVDAGGRLVHASVRESSGLGFLDDEAMQALSLARPFPPPPAALAGPDGGLSFRLGFLFAVDPKAEPCAPPTDAPPLVFAGTALAPVCDRVYVDPATGAERRPALRELEAKSGRRVADVFGALTSRAPLTVVCESDACRVYFSGPTRRSCIIKPGETASGGSYASAGEPTIVIDRTDARAVNELAHDRAHLELRARVGDAFVPQWFNDGLATLVADEPACAGRDAIVVDDLRHLDSREAWHELADHVSPAARAAVYCEARRVVERWIAAHGKAGLRALLADLAAGRDFYAAYERPGGAGIDGPSVRRPY
jgi:TonB family protein